MYGLKNSKAKKGNVPKEEQVLLSTEIQFA